MAERKTDVLRVRVAESEKDAFRFAAEVAGVPLSVWVRERLRLAAYRELTAEDGDVAFMEDS